MPKFSFFCIVATVYVAIASCEDTYDAKYDSVDVDEILKSERLLSNYINCLLDEGPCTDYGRDLKDILPDAINTDCSKCTEKQKEGSDEIMHFMWVFLTFNLHWIYEISFRIENRPDDWKMLEEKFDQTGKYREGYIEAKAAGKHDDN